MADFRTVTETVSVAPQITSEEVTEAADAGFSLIINNRPDGEEAGQPTDSELAEAAEAAGVSWIHLPIIPGEIRLEDVERMALAMKDSGGKTLAFCRSGTRSCTLWALASAYLGGTPTDEILNRAGAAGYNIAGMAPTLEHLHKNAGN